MQSPCLNVLFTSTPYRHLSARSSQINHDHHSPDWWDHTSFGINRTTPEGIVELTSRSPRNIVAVAQDSSRPAAKTMCLLACTLVALAGWLILEMLQDVGAVDTAG